MNKYNDVKKDSFQTMSALVGDEDASYKNFFTFVLIQRNLELIEAYNDLARSMKNEELKTFFSDMARLKYDDMKHFQTIYGQNGMEGLEKEKQETLSSILKGEPKNPAIKNMDEACKYVLNVEVKNLQLYFRMSQLETDPSIKKLFSDAHRMHKSNLNHLEKRMKSFSSAK